MNTLCYRLLSCIITLSLLVPLPCGAKSPALARTQTKAGTRPNILLLLTDDQRYDAIRALGNPDVQTPNMDSLVASGTTITHTFDTVPVCTPARAELITGRSAFRNGVRFFNTPIPRQHALLSQTLADAGYVTWFTGKWHSEGRPEDHGFQIVRRAFLRGMGAHEMTFEEKGEKITGFSSELFAEAAIDFLQRKQTKPWFMYVSFTSPHDPRTPPGKYKTMYDPVRLQLPKNFMPEHPFDNGEMTMRDEQLTPWPRTPDAIRRHLADYYGMISHLDEQIGRILRTLKESSQADNTIIIFASDNGLAIGSHGLMGKMSMYDHSVRVPLIISGPGIPSNVNREGMAYLYDLFPTVCELTNTPVPQTVEGKSLVPVLKGEQKEVVREEVFTAYRDVQRAVRTRRWKLIHYPRINKTQLFDVVKDPSELTDLMEEWRYRKNSWYEPPADYLDAFKIAAGLREKLLVWQKEVADSPEKGADRYQ